MKKFCFVLAFYILISAQAQNTQPIPSSVGFIPNFSQQTKASGDSCGAYYNNYVGLIKTSLVFFEALRTGADPDFVPYGGRAQRFHANQPIEISGIRFYAFETNLTVDSLMAITMLHDYTAVNDSVGVLLAVDTVWVTHQNFTSFLSDIEVNSKFDNPVIVTSDYMVSVVSPSDDSLKIIVSSAAANDGAGEGVSYLIYNNPDFLSAAGYYNGLSDYGVTYDLDYLISPRIKFDLNDGFMITDDSICPKVVNAGCVNYTQVQIYSEAHYNGFSSSPTDHILWLWGDGYQNTNLLSACHTYVGSGDFDITLRDTFARHDFGAPICVSEVVQPIHVIPDVIPNFTFIANGTVVDFANTSTSSDSVWWDFGDASAGTSLNDPQHTYNTIGTYDVWLYAFNDCSEDSIMIQVTIDDIGLEDYDFDFKIYPNPANGYVTVDGIVEGASVELINILGETLDRKVGIQPMLKLKTDKFSVGIYFVCVSTEYGNVKRKLLIRH